MPADSCGPCHRVLSYPDDGTTLRRVPSATEGFQSCPGDHKQGTLPAMWRTGAKPSRKNRRRTQFTALHWSLSWLAVLAVLLLGYCTDTANCAGELEFKVFQRLYASSGPSRGSWKGRAGVGAAELRRRCDAGCHLTACARHLDAPAGARPEDCALGAARALFAFQRDAPAGGAAAGGETALTLQFNDSWQGTFALTVEIRDDSTLEVLATQTFERAEFLPIARNWTQMDASLSLPADGPSGSERGPGRLDLSLRVRAKCARHYYGRHCAVHCDPTAEASATGAGASPGEQPHFDCVAETGTRRCRMGWRGPRCDQRAERCVDVECANGDCNPETGQCVCRAGYRGAKCDQCVTWAECKGRCTRPYECLCPEGRGGPNCDKDMVYCAHNSPCQNGGICANDRNGSYTCTCAPGFSGRNCERRIDSCADAPCRNGAVCHSGFRCHCSAGVYGRYCQSRARGCVDQPCANNASCFETTPNAWSRPRSAVNAAATQSTPPFECRCTRGWSGALCDTPSSWCSPDKCLNGGVCMESANSALGFVCRCASGFTGARCDWNVDDCANNQCRNNGTCVDEIGGFRCRCLPGFGGPLCERISPQDANNDASAAKDNDAIHAANSSSLSPAAASPTLPNAKLIAGALLFIIAVLLLLVACVWHLRVHLSAKISETQQQHESGSRSSTASPVTSTTLSLATAAYELDVDALHEDIAAQKRRMDELGRIEHGFGDDKSENGERLVKQRVDVRTAALAADRHTADSSSSDSHCGHCCAIAPPPSYAETFGEDSPGRAPKEKVDSNTAPTTQPNVVAEDGRAIVVLEDFESLPIRNTSNGAMIGGREELLVQQHRQQGYCQSPSSSSTASCSSRSPISQANQRQRNYLSAAAASPTRITRSAVAPRALLSFSDDSVIVDMDEDSVVVSASRLRSDQQQQQYARIRQAPLKPPRPS